VLEVGHAEIEEVKLFDDRYEKRFRLWKNRDTFHEQHRVWYLDNFEEQDAEKIVKTVEDYHT